MLSRQLRPSCCLELSIPRDCSVCRAQLTASFHSYSKLREQEKSTPPSREPSPSATTTVSSTTRRQRTARAFDSIQKLQKLPVGLRGGQFPGGSSPELRLRTAEPLSANKQTTDVDKHNTETFVENSSSQSEFTIRRVQIVHPYASEKRLDPNFKITEDKNESGTESTFRITKVELGRDHDDKRRPLSTGPRRSGQRATRRRTSRGSKDEDETSPLEFDDRSSEHDPDHPGFIDNLIESGLIKKPEFKPLDLSTRALVTNRIAHAAGEEGVRSEMLQAMGRLSRRPNLDWTVDADLARRLNHGELIKFNDNEERFRITAMAEMFAERTAAKISRRKGVEVKKQDVGFVPVAGEERNRLVDKVLKGKYELPPREGEEVSVKAEKEKMIGQAAVALKLNGSYTTGGSQRVLEMLRANWPAQATPVRRPNVPR